MTLDAQSRACERARTWAALAPDGELSQLELRLLQAHVDRCPACARVAVDIEAISAAIRSAPLEPPPEPIGLPLLRRRSLLDRVPGGHLGGRLAAVAAVGLVAFAMGTRSSDRVVESAPMRPIVIDETELEAANAEPAELRTFRREALLGDAYAARLVRRPSGPQPV